MTDTTVFYNKEDSWDIAQELFNSKPQNMEPYYTVMQIPGTGQSEFVLILPFTPASSSTNTRNNMVAWMAARMDTDHYGELLLYKLPKNIEIDGPLQIESRIDQIRKFRNSYPYGISKALVLSGESACFADAGKLPLC